MTVASAATIDAHVRVRGGIGDVGRRLRDEARTVAYLGASVTAQRDGYRPRLHELLVRGTGRPHRSVAAGTGAMGSITGVFLMDDLVLRQRPDLCFVEYATSDAAGTTPADHVGAAVEGIVTKLREAASELCFLYLFRTDGGVDLSRIVVEAHERVAERHAVPSIDVAAWLEEQVKAGEVSERDLVRDGVHTTSLGSDVTAGAIARGLALIAAAEPPSARPVAPALYARSFREARVVRATPEHAADRDRCTTGTFRLAYPFVEIDSANELRCAPDGELVGLVVVVGPDSGFIEVEAASGVHEYELWDDTCFYDRLSSVIFTPFCRAGEQVRIRLTERQVDYSRCRRPLENPAAIRKRLKVIGFMVRP